MAWLLNMGGIAKAKNAREQAAKSAVAPIVMLWALGRRFRMATIPEDDLEAKFPPSMVHRANTPRL